MYQSRLDVGNQPAPSQVGSTMRHSGCKLLTMPWISILTIPKPDSAVIVHIASRHISDTIFEAQVGMAGRHRQDVLTTLVQGTMVLNTVQRGFQTLPVPVSLKTAIVEESGALIKQKVGTLVDRGQMICINHDALRCTPLPQNFLVMKPCFPYTRGL